MKFLEECENVVKKRKDRELQEEDEYERQQLEEGRLAEEEKTRQLRWLIPNFFTETLALEARRLKFQFFVNDILPDFAHQLMARRENPLVCAAVTVDNACMFWVEGHQDGDGPPTFKLYLYTHLSSRMVASYQEKHGWRVPPQVDRATTDEEHGPKSIVIRGWQAKHERSSDMNDAFWKDQRELLMAEILKVYEENEKRREAK